MQITAASEEILAALDPATEAAVRANVARVREMSEDELRRIASLVGLRGPRPVNP